MKRIVAFFVEQTLFGNLLTFSVIVLGLISAFSIRRETFPNINFDIISIQTAFPGASPDDSEKLITNPLEQDLQEVDGIKKFVSISTDNISNIVIFLDPDQTTEVKGKNDIEDVVNKFTELPAGAKDPVVAVMESKTQPLVEVALAANRPPLELRAMAKDLEREIEKVKGVARVVHRGLRDLEIHIEPNVRKLAENRVSLDELVASLARQNVSVPAGVIEAGGEGPSKAERFVRVVGEYQNLEDVGNTVVRANDLGRPILVKDVATVKYDLSRRTILTKTNGLPSQTLTVLKREKADAINLVDNLKDHLTKQKSKLGGDVEINYVNDLSNYVRNRLSVLNSNFAIGMVLVFLMLPFFMPFRFAVIVGMGVPFAFLGVLTMFYFGGVSISLVSMIGLILVCGILVDDAIVVSENCARLIEKGVPSKQAAIEATVQVIPSVTASVLTTVVAFAPLMFMSGIFGKFVYYIPLGVILALMTSLFEAFIILPGHVADWLTPQYIAKLKSATPKTAIGRFSVWFKNWWDTTLTDGYIRILRRFVAKRYWVMGGMVLLFAGSLLLAVKGMRFVLFPAEGVEIFFIRTEAPSGTSLEEHGKLLEPIEKLVGQLPKGEVDNFSTTVGLVQQDPNDPNTRRGAEFAQIAVYLTPEQQRDRTAAQIIEQLRGDVGERKEFKHVLFQRVNPGPPTGKAISLSVQGKEYEDILPAVKELEEVLAKIDGVTDVSNGYLLGKEEIRVNVNSGEASAAGLSVASIGNTVRAVYEGVVASTLRSLDEEVDVRVLFPSTERASEEALEKVLVPNPQGALIPLKQVASFTKTRGLSVHEHQDGARQVKVTADVDSKKTSSMEVNNKLKVLLPELNAKYPKLNIVFGGEDEDTQESLKSLGFAFLMAAFGILLILVMTFKNLLQSFVVMLTIPIGIIAVVIVFFLHGMPLSFMSIMGIIALAGIIVNNAIVLVDFVNQARAEGQDPFESIFVGARDRLRPIFLTTATTVVGILPTAYGIGGLDKFVVPIAMALGWGVAFGSVMTAFAFPAALGILNDFELFWQRRRS